MQPWKVLICDDDETIHELTSFILSDFTFLNRELQLLHAYSSEECLVTLKEHPEIAILLQDMIMEDDDTGIQITETIRNQLNNKALRIILRTGKSVSKAPRELVEQYDISDYIDKTEFTSQKLHMALYTKLMDFHRIKEA